MDKNEGGPERRVLSSSVTALPPPTLPQLGITRNQSAAWQRIAAIPATDFEEHVDATKAAGGGRAEPHADKPGRDGGGGVEGNPVGIRRGFGEARTRSDAGVLGRGVVDRADTWPRLCPKSGPPVRQWVGSHNKAGLKPPPSRRFSWADAIVVLHVSAQADFSGKAPGPLERI